MASIRTLPNGRIFAQVRRKNFKSINRVFDSRAEAEAWSRGVMVDMDRGVIKPVSGAEYTIREAFDKYLKTVTVTKKGAKQEGYKVVNFVVACGFADKSLRDVKPADVSAYVVRRMKRDGISGPTVNRELGLLSHVYETASKAWGVEGLQNPVRLIQKPKEHRARDRRVNVLPTGVTELELVLGHVQDARLKLVYRLLVELACRRGELLKLTWANVNLDERWLRFEDTKNGDSRVIPLSVEAVALLRELRTGSTGALVVGMTGDRVSSAWRLARSKAKIGNLRLHDLRREGVSRLFEDVGLSSLEVSAISGHRTLSMLQRYTSLRRAGLLAKLDKANEVKATANSATAHAHESNQQGVAPC